MDVSTAVKTRYSCRAFTSEPVDTQLITSALEAAARAPSGGNVQPWKVFVLTGARLDAFRQIMKRRLSGEVHPDGDRPEYPVYPDKLIEPYRTARFEVGEAMYGLLKIPREDKAARLEWFANNYRFFGAPAAIFCFVDRMMGPPQWSDLGMFLQTFMLLLEEQGVQSCAQECWSYYPNTVADFCNAPDNWMLFCGMAIGHEDKSHPVNRLRTARLPADQWLEVL